jgi:hypothetical protein
MKAVLESRQLRLRRRFVATPPAGWFKAKQRRRICESLICKQGLFKFSYFETGKFGTKLGLIQVKMDKKRQKQLKADKTLISLFTGG